MIDYTKLSKEVSYALLHNPFKYGIEIDEEGWVLISQLLSALHKDKKWSNVTENDLVLMIEKSKKKRHIILNGKIKAFYGHSISIKNNTVKVYLCLLQPQRLLFCFPVY